MSAEDPVHVAKLATAAPRQAQDARITALLSLLNTEEQARDCKDEQELVFVAANETRKHIKARQIFVVRSTSRRNMRVVGITALDSVDRNTPMVRWIERLVQKHRKTHGLADSARILSSDYRDKEDVEEATYPFKRMLWIPLVSTKGDVFAGMLATREQPWSEADLSVAMRLGRVYAHAWQSLRGVRALSRGKPWARIVTSAFALGILAAGFIPVPLTVLAPVEVTPRNALVVAAPFDGVVDSVVAEPNAHVRAGDLLVEMEDISLRNALELAEQQVGVAKSKLERLYRAAYNDEASRQELRTAVSELKVRSSERDYARALLAKSRILAERAGVAVFSDKKEWSGRPVSTGVKILQIADPRSFEFTVELPVGDSIALKVGARAKIFLDADPLNSLETEVMQASYEATVTSSDVLAYRVTTRLPSDNDELVRLGARGTAQVYGDMVSLYFYVFRRPLSYLRQQFGL